MARKYTPGAMGQWYKSRMQKMEEGLEEAMKDAGEVGAETMRDLIRTRGTGHVWSRPWGKSGREASIPGRVDTGKMLNAVGSRTTRQGGSLQLRVGWVSGTREDYFWLQNQGFDHPLGMKVEGMFALQDATEAAFTELQKSFPRRIK